MKDSPHLFINLPEVKSCSVVYRGYFDVQIESLQLPHGATMDYTSVKIGTHAAAVLARTKDGKLIINKEYRHPTGKWILSCPGGRIDQGESPLEAGQRELLEETGYGGGKPRLLNSAYPFPSVSDQIIHYILIEDAELLQPVNHEPFELIQTELKTLEELKKEIISGFPVDGVLCTALFFFQMFSYHA